MIKFINNIDNLISDILDVEKVLVIFFENNNINSLQLIEKLNIYDMDLVGKIILVDYNIFLKENYNKLNVGFITNYIKYTYKNHLEDQVNNLSFLIFENIKNIKFPQLYFLKKKEKVMELKYNSQYLTNYTDNNIINLITYFFKNSENNKQKKNNYVKEFNNNGEVCLDLNEADIETNIIFI
jgi:hypothetical protein